jgi:hypothetical protein
VLDSHPLIIEEELHQKSFHPDFLEDYDRAKEEISVMDYLKSSDESWKPLYFLMPTMHMTTRLGAPLQESLFLLVAPQSCGPVSIKAVLQHQLTQLSLSQGGPL